MFLLSKIIFQSLKIIYHYSLSILLNFYLQNFLIILLKNIFFSKKLNKKKGQILFDNFEAMDILPYRYIVLKNIANVFNLDIKSFNLGKNLIYYLIYYSFGVSNISFFLFSIKKIILIKKIYLKRSLK